VATVLYGRVPLPGRTRSPDMLNELIQNAMHSSPQGFLGVSLIAIYFCVIVATAFYRIGKGDHMHH
jgi:hypothetical protein